MTVREIIIKYLKDRGFDGLFMPGECACIITDLMPGEGCDGCEPGYLQPCVESDEEDSCPMGAPGTCTWHIGREKPEAKAYLEIRERVLGKR